MSKTSLIHAAILTEHRLVTEMDSIGP